MKTYICVAFLCVVLLVSPTMAADFVANRWILEVDAELSFQFEKDVDSRLLNLDSRYKLQKLFHKPADSHKQSIWYEMGLDRWYILDWQMPLSDPELALKQNKNVIRIHRDTIGEICTTPDDLDNYDVWALDQMNCETAWDIHHSANDIIVAIIDTGIEPEHEDLVGQIWINSAEDLNNNGEWDDVDNNGIDDDGNGYIDDIYGYDFVSITENQITQLGIEPIDNQDYAPQDNEVFPDYVGHGTFCGGIAGAATNNGIGVASVSWGCTLMPVRVAFPVSINGQQTGIMTMSDFAAGVQYAADNGADVISMSLASSQTLPAVESALNYAYAFAILSVAGAGNASTDQPWYPAAYNNVISVAATDRNDYLANFSCYGSTVDLCAPGVDIISTTPGDGMNPLVYTGHSGTSASTPIVSGAIALLLSSEPLFNVFTISDRLADACVNIDLLNPGYSGFLGAGRLDVNLLLGGTNRIEDETLALPEGFSMSSPYPNPFNATTRLSFEIASPQVVKINVFDVCGREVGVITNKKFQSGKYDFHWDASNLASGVYFIRAKHLGGEKMDRVMLVK